MRTPGQQASTVFTLTGCIVVAVTLLLFFQLREPADRGATFIFTVWFVIFQEALFFGGLTFTGLLSGSSQTAVPVRIGYMTTIVLYNVLAVATILVFNLKLMPDYASAKTYYTISVGETGLWLALLVVMQVVDIAHHAAHREAVVARGNVDQLILMCDRIRSLSEAHKWPLTNSMPELAERIRFSEGLRRNDGLTKEVADKLTELERQVSGANDNAAQTSAEQLAKDIAIMVSRRG